MPGTLQDSHWITRCFSSWPDSTPREKEGLGPRCAAVKAVAIPPDQQFHNNIRKSSTIKLLTAKGQTYYNNNNDDTNNNNNRSNNPRHFCFCSLDHHDVLKRLHPHHHRLLRLHFRPHLRHHRLLLHPSEAETKPREESCGLRQTDSA